MAPVEVFTSRLSVGRGAVNDVAVHGRGLPLFPVDREMRLATVVATRATAPGSATQLL